MAGITIFGTGSMGAAIGGLLAAGGSDVTHIDTSTAAPVITGDIVVLAVPYPALAAIVEKHGAALAGRIVVDISNPLDFSTFDSLVVPADSSAAAELAARLPDSRVLKAFNTNFAATLASGTVGANRTVVLVAGDDSEAKSALVAAVTASGTVDAIDAGSLARSRELESIGFLQLTLAVQEKLGWTAGFAVVR